MNYNRIPNKTPNGAKARSRKIVSGNIVEILTDDSGASGCPVRRIDKDHYINLNKPVDFVNGDFLEADTGELVTESEIESNVDYIRYKTGKVYKLEKIIHNEKRVQQSRTLLRTFANIRRTVNEMTKQPERCRWTTLTYRENMTDTKQLYRDTQAFLQRLRTFVTNTFGGLTFDYFQVVEPQERGAWHVHMILRFPAKAPYISNKVFQEIWGKGFTEVKKLDDNDGIGNYLSAYLTDIPLKSSQKPQNGEEIVVKVVDGKQKKFIKGGRLSLYPLGMNIFRKSRSVTIPKPEPVEPNECREYSEKYAIVYESTHELTDGNFRITFNRKQYNTKRLKGGEAGDGQRSNKRISDRPTDSRQFRQNC